MFQAVGFVGVQRGAVVDGCEFRALTAWGKKAVEQSGGAGLITPGTVYLRVGAGRDCGRGGWGPSRYYCLLEHRVRKNVQDGGERGH